MQPVFHQPGLEKSPLGRLYQRHWLAIFLAICQQVPSREDAEDILLDVFLAALESRTLLSLSESHQEAWLRRVAYNKCMDVHRRVSRRPAVPLSAHEETLYEDECWAPEWMAVRQEEFTHLQGLLASLSPIQQELLRLRFADELPCAQIAARLHKSESAIRQMLSRTLKRLRAMYTKREDRHHDPS